MEAIDNQDDELPDIVLCSVKRIYDFADPFSCWNNIDGAVEFEEIQKAVDNFDHSIKYEDLKPTQVFKNNPMTVEELKEAHIQKIAFFVINGVDMKIDFDVGVDGYNLDFHMVADGNHRLAAAIFRGDKNILVEWSGNEERLKDWGLLAQHEEKKMKMK